MVTSTTPGFRGVYFLKSEKPGITLFSITRSGANNTLYPSGKWNNRNGLRMKYPNNAINMNILSDTTIRIAFLQKATVFRSGKSMTLVESTGYCAEIMKILQEKLNFKTTLVLTNSFGNKKKTGGGSGAVGLLMRNEADVSPLDFNPTIFRREVVDFTRDIGTDAVNILTAIPGPVARPFILLQIFTPMAWAVILLAAIASGVILGLLQRHAQSGDDNEKGVNYIWNGITSSCKSFVAQPILKLPTSGVLRVFSISILVVSLIVLSIYKGYIIAILAIPVSSKPIDSVQDFLESDMKSVVRRDTSFHSLIEYGILSDMVPRMDLHLFKYVKSKEFLNRLAANQFALFDAASSLLGYRRSYERSDQPCALYMSKSEVISMPDTFALRRNSPYKAPFDEIIRWLRSYGLIEFYKKQYYQISCKVQVVRTEPMPLTIYQIQSAFYIILVGYGFACTALIIEICLAWSH